MDDGTPVNASDAGMIDIGDDLTVNRLGCGAMRLTDQGVSGAPPDREAATALLRRAVDLGLNFIDIADSYGPLPLAAIVVPAPSRTASHGEVRNLAPSTALMWLPPDPSHLRLVPAGRSPS